LVRGIARTFFGYIEKRSLDLDLVKSIEIKTYVWSSGEINVIGINSATSDVWTVGLITFTETVLTTSISPTTITTTVKETVIPIEFVVTIVIAIVILAIAMVYILRMKKRQ